MNSGISYDQIIKSINNLASSKVTLENFMVKKSKEFIKKNKWQDLLRFKTIQ